LSYHRLLPIYFVFVFVLSFVSIPKIDVEALSHPRWHNAMDMSALLGNTTWELVHAPLGKSTVGF